LFNCSARLCLDRGAVEDFFLLWELQKLRLERFFCLKKR
jgi:hypothetical protein